MINRVLIQVLVSIYILAGSVEAHVNEGQQSFTGTSYSNNSYTEHSVNITNSGAYTFKCRVACASGGGIIKVCSGTTTVGTMTVPVTGGLSIWTTVTGPVNLKARTQTVRLLFLGSNKSFCKITWMDIKAQIPASNFISIKAKANGRFISVCADKTLRPLADTVTLNEQFILINNPDGSVSLKSNSRNAAGQIVCADPNNHNSELLTKRAGNAGWESLKRINNADGTVSFMASNGMYVVAENGGNATLVANRTTIGDWEKFYLEPVNAALPVSVVTGLLAPDPEMAILLYPNPVASVLTITTEMEYTTATVLDYTGRVLLEASHNFEKHFSMDLSSLPSGAYVLQFQSREELFSKKFFKL